MSNNVIACGSDTDCAGIGDNGNNGGDACGDLEEICKIYTCCDECKAEGGLAVVNKRASDLGNYAVKTNPQGWTSTSNLLVSSTVSYGGQQLCYVCHGLASS
jgi:hypothetical protein